MNEAVLNPSGSLRASTQVIVHQDRTRTIEFKVHKIGETAPVAIVEPMTPFSSDIAAKEAAQGLLNAFQRSGRWPDLFIGSERKTA